MAATLDEMTGSINRRRITELGRLEVERAHRYGRPLSVLLLDIDHFKHVNDTFGHATGDVVLKALARIVERTLRRSDLFARHGGEEFLALLPETRPEFAAHLAERVREAIEKELVVSTDDGPLRCTVSIGIASIDASHNNWVDLLEAADVALYTAKALGRNRCFSAPYGMGETLKDPVLMAQHSRPDTVTTPEKPAR